MYSASRERQMSDMLYKQSVWQMCDVLYKQEKAGMGWT